MTQNVVSVLLALALIGLGVFLIKSYGQSRYQNGYDTCVVDAKAVIEKTARELENQRNEVIPDDGVMLKLRANGWLRPDGDL